MTIDWRKWAVTAATEIGHLLAHFIVFMGVGVAIIWAFHEWAPPGLGELLVAYYVASRGTDRVLPEDWQ